MPASPAIRGHRPAARCRKSRSRSVVRTNRRGAGLQPARDTRSDTSRHGRRATGLTDPDRPAPVSLRSPRRSRHAASQPVCSSDEPSVSRSLPPRRRRTPARVRRRSATAVPWTIEPVSARPPAPLAMLLHPVEAFISYLEKRFHQPIVSKKHDMRKLSFLSARHEPEGRDATRRGGAGRAAAGRFRCSPPDFVAIQARCARKNRRRSGATSRWTLESRFGSRGSGVEVRESDHDSIARIENASRTALLRPHVRPHGAAVAGRRPGQPASPRPAA